MPSAPGPGTTRQELFTQIARKHLDINTLEVRNQDHLDFHDVAVWGVQKALETAYQAGVEAGQKRRPPRGKKREKKNA